MNAISTLHLPFLLPSGDRTGIGDRPHHKSTGTRHGSAPTSVLLYHPGFPSRLCRRDFSRSPAGTRASCLRDHFCRRILRDLLSLPYGNEKGTAPGLTLPELFLFLVFFLKLFLISLSFSYSLGFSLTFQFNPHLFINSINESGSNSSTLNTPAFFHVPFMTSIVPIMAGSPDIYAAACDPDLL